MKNILTVFAVLAMASVANAGMSISVDGVVSPPDSSITLNVGDTAVIDIHADETEMTWLTIQGPGSIDASAPTDLWEQSAVGNMDPALLPDYIAALADLGYPGVVDIIEADILDAVEPFTKPTDLVANGLIFTCLGEGDVVLTLMDLETNVFDAVTIHQIPEPLTLGLLGLGGLFLRRRR